MIGFILTAICESRATKAYHVTILPSSYVTKMVTLKAESFSVQWNNPTCLST